MFNIVVKLKNKYLLDESREVKVSYGQYGACMSSLVLTPRLLFFMLAGVLGVRSFFPITELKQ